jgi:hypothetical protein
VIPAGLPTGSPARKFVKAAIHDVASRRRRLGSPRKTRLGSEL